MRVTLRWLAAAALVLAAAWLWPGDGMAREVPVVTGVNWTSSTPQEREAFLLGATTMLELEQEVQGANPPPKEKSLVNAWCRGLSFYTLDELRQAVDAYYQGHPDKMARPVLEVMWFELVLPHAEGK